jgi:hypothetical protein
MNIDDSTLICPITQQIFSDPCILNSGITYERSAIERWSKTKNECPQTKIEITSMSPNIIVKQIVENYLTIYPEKKQFVYQIYFNSTDFIKLHSTKLQIQYLDQCTNLEKNDENHHTDNELEMKPIHWICIHSKPKIIKHMIDKGVDLNVKDNNGQTPIFYACKHSTLEIIKYMIVKGVDLNVKDNDGQTLILHACKHSTLEIIKYIIDKGVDLKMSKIIMAKHQFFMHVNSQL